MVGKAAGIQGNKGMPSARTEVMNRPRKEFFAGARFPRQQHGHVRVSNQWKLGEQLSERGAFSYQEVKMRPRFGQVYSRLQNSPPNEALGSDTQIQFANRAEHEVVQRILKRVQHLHGTPALETQHR